MIKQLSSNKNYVFLLLLFLGCHKKNPKDITALLSVTEAENFCTETWFPLLKLSSPVSSQKIAAALDKLLDIYEDEIEIVDPNSEEMVAAGSFKGKEQIAKYYEAVYTNYPDWEVKILGIYPTVKGFVLRYEGLNAGLVKRFEGVNLIELKQYTNKWKIAKIYGYYDRVPFIESVEP